jgi:hypothetical protein
MINAIFAISEAKKAHASDSSEYPESGLTQVLIPAMTPSLTN